MEDNKRKENKCIQGREQEKLKYTEFQFFYVRLLINVFLIFKKPMRAIEYLLQSNFYCK